MRCEVPPHCGQSPGLTFISPISFSASEEAAKPGSAEATAAVVASIVTTIDNRTQHFRLEFKGSLACQAQRDMLKINAFATGAGRERHMKRLEEE